MKSRCLVQTLLVAGAIVSAQAVSHAQSISVVAPTEGASVDVVGSGAGASSPVELFVNGASAAQATSDAGGAILFPAQSLNAGDALVVQNQVSWYFGTDGDAEGWDTAEGNATASVAGGTLTLTAGAAPNRLDMTMGLPTDTIKVLEFRLRNPGTANQINVILNDTVVMPTLAFPIQAGNPDFVTYQLPIVSSVPGKGVPPGGTNWWLYLDIIGATAADELEFDYIRAREYVDFHFDNDGDLMNNTVVNGTGTVSGGALTLTNTTAATNAYLDTIFWDYDTSIFDTLQTAIDANPTIAPVNLANFYYFGEGPAYSAGGHHIAWTVDPGTSVVVTKDLTDPPLFGGTWSGEASLNYPGGWFSPIYPDTAGEEAIVDYIRIRPATYFGPSAPVEVLAGPPPVVTYTWDGGAAGDWTTASNWDPERDTPSTDDILVFNTSAAVTGLVSETIAGLVVEGGAEVSLEAGAATTLTIDGDPDGFHVAAGSELRLTGGSALTIAVPNAGGGLIEGDMVFNATAAVAHRILASVAGAVVVANGGTTAMAPTGASGGSGFGGSADGGVILQAGAVHNQGGEKDGTRNGGSGIHPFNAISFEPGSEYVVWFGFPNLVARSYANFTYRGTAGSALTAATAPNTYSGDYRVEFSGVVGEQGTVGLGTGNTSPGDVFVIEGNFHVVGDGEGPTFAMFGTPSADQFMRVRGDFIVDNPDRFAVDGSTARFIVLDGTSQTADPNGAAMRNLVIDSDVELVSPISVLNSVDIQSGSLTASGEGRLLLGAAAEPAPASYTGPLGSAERLSVTGLNTATLQIPDAPVSFEVTSTGTGGTGVFLGWSDDSAPVGITGATPIDRTWTLGLIKASGYEGTLSLTYDDDDIPVGVDEDNLVAARWDGSAWVILAADSTADSASNTVTVTGVTEFSDWTLVELDATNVDEWLLLHN